MRRMHDSRVMWFAEIFVLAGTYLYLPKLTFLTDSKSQPVASRSRSSRCSRIGRTRSLKRKSGNTVMSKNSKIDWDYPTEQAFISEVHAKPSLWNKADASYKNGRLKGKVWDAIANKLRIEKGVLKGKWNSLRNKFASEKLLESLSRSGDSAEAAYTSTWPHYQSMRFLSDATTPIVTDSNLNDIFETDFEDSEEEDWKEGESAAGQKYKPNKMAYKPKTKTKTGQTNMDNHLSSADNIKDSLTDNSSHKNVRIILSNFLAEMSDDDVLFFKTLASYVKMIRPEQMLDFRNDVNTIVKGYVYGSNNNISPRQTTSENDNDCIIVSDTITKVEENSTAIKQEKEKNHAPAILCGNVKKETEYQPNPYSMMKKDNYSEPNRCGMVKQERDFQPCGMYQQGYGLPLFGYPNPHVQSQRYYWDHMMNGNYQTQQHPSMLPVQYVQERQVYSQYMNSSNFEHQVPQGLSTRYAQGAGGYDPPALNIHGRNWDLPYAQGAPRGSSRHLNGGPVQTSGRNSALPYAQGSPGDSSAVFNAHGGPSQTSGRNSDLLHAQESSSAQLNVHSGPIRTCSRNSALPYAQGSPIGTSAVLNAHGGPSQTSGRNSDLLHAQEALYAQESSSAQLNVHRGPIRTYSRKTALPYAQAAPEGHTRITQGSPGGSSSVQSYVQGPGGSIPSAEFYAQRSSALYNVEEDLPNNSSLAALDEQEATNEDTNKVSDGN